MELPRWAFKAESVARRDGSIDMVFRLRPLGRLWLYVRALVELARTTAITITIEFQDERPVVTHAGERIDPSDDPEAYTLTAREIYQLVKQVPSSGIDELIRLAQERKVFENEIRDRRKA